MLPKWGDVRFYVIEFRPRFMAFLLPSSSSSPRTGLQPSHATYGDFSLLLFVAPAYMREVRGLGLRTGN